MASGSRRVYYQTMYFYTDRDSILGCTLKDYQMIETLNPDELKKKVLKLVKKGWVFRESARIVIEPVDLDVEEFIAASNSRRVYYQAMCFYIDHGDDSLLSDYQMIETLNPDELKKKVLKLVKEGWVAKDTAKIVIEPVDLDDDIILMNMFITSN